MANPTVDKLKDLGLRHGEKVLVGAAAGVCLLFVSMAMNTPTINLTPDAVKAAAAAAQLNITRNVNRDELAKKFEGDFLKLPDLAKKVEEVANHRPVATAGLEVFVVPDPSTGFLRDLPVVLAPFDLNAQSGRGGALVYDRDKDGEIVYEETKAEATPKGTKPKPKAKAKRGSSSGDSGGGSGGRGFSAGVVFGEPSPAPAGGGENSKEARKNKNASAEITGKDMDEEEKAAPKEEETPVEEDRKPREVIKGYRWIVVTGLFDNQKQRDLIARALKIDFPTAYPAFERLEVQKRRLNHDGTWGEWEPVDREKNLQILENVPEIDKERTIDESRLKPLVDELPFLKTGYWRGVHHVALLTDSERATRRPKAAAAAAAPGMGNSGGIPGRSPAAMGAAVGRAPGMGRGDTDMSAGMTAMRPPGNDPRSAEDMDFPRSNTERLMVRMLDFDVEPEATYRYRARVILRNPNRNRDDVSLGVDTRSKELEGPWGDPTPAVTVPPDKSTYALAKATVSPRGDEVKFQVAAWNDEDGQTIVKEFDAAPGQVIGQQVRMRVPDAKTNKMKATPIDFISRQLVLDTESGTRQVNQQLGLKPGPELEVPATAVVVRPDGAVVVRNQARDQRDPEMRDAKFDFDEAVKDAEGGKKRDSGGAKAASSGNSGMPAGVQGYVNPMAPTRPRKR